MADKHIYICDGDGYVNDDGNYVTIHLDYDCDSPRHYDNLGTFYTWMRSYSSPDDAPDDLVDILDDFNLTDALEDALAEVEHSNDALIDRYLRDEANYRHQRKMHKQINDACRMLFGENYMPQTLEDLFGDELIPTLPRRPRLKQLNVLMWVVNALNEHGCVALPVSCYEHGGVVYRTGSPSQFPDSRWDAGYVGIIYATYDRICEMYGVDEVTQEVVERVRNDLSAEVDVYSEWAEGNCYGFVVHDKDDNEIDSCWGFIGSDAYESGLADQCNGLNDTDMSLDEWLAA